MGRVGTRFAAPPRREFNVAPLRVQPAGRVSPVPRVRRGSLPRRADAVSFLDPAEQALFPSGNGQQKPCSRASDSPSAATSTILASSNSSESCRSRAPAWTARNSPSSPQPLSHNRPRAARARTRLGTRSVAEHTWPASSMTGLSGTALVLPAEDRAQGPVPAPGSSVGFENLEPVRFKDQLQL